MRNIVKKQNGITLIALVVTIIVLIILAGVSIAMLVGENGIITQAQRAAQETEQAKRDEEAGLSSLETAIQEALGNVYNEEKGVNKPKLITGMIPVKFDTSKNGGKGNWVICSEMDEEWYNYDETDKRWANVMLCDGTYDENTPIGTEIQEKDLGSMFVWIPRYAYKITSGYHDAPNGGIDVKFLIGTTNETADASNVNEYNSETTNNYTKFPDGYVVHPAFQNGQSTGYQNGEWKKEITGIWVAKFEAGIKTIEEDTDKTVSSVNNYYYPVFKGRKYAYNYVTVNDCYNLSLALDDEQNPYGLSDNANSHLMKDSEWGAVAYLSMSQYGYSGGEINTSTVIYKNNLSLDETVDNPNNIGKIYSITGYSATGEKEPGNKISINTSVEELLTDEIGSSNKSYAWTVVDNGKDSGLGTKASTTGNIYGIYDMSGGVTEYMATYINNVAYAEYGNMLATGKSTYLATAYPNEGTIEAELNTAYGANIFNKIYGNAVYETSKNVGIGLTWFAQTVENDSDGNEVFCPRGGSSNTVSFVGLCGLSDSDGNAHNSSGFRSVLIVE